MAITLFIWDHICVWGVVLVPKKVLQYVDKIVEVALVVAVFAAQLAMDSGLAVVPTSLLVVAMLPSLLAIHK